MQEHCGTKKVTCTQSTMVSPLALRTKLRKGAPGASRSVRSNTSVLTVSGAPASIRAKRIKLVDWVPPTQLTLPETQLKEPSFRDGFNAKLRRRLASMKQSGLPRRLRMWKCPCCPKFCLRRRVAWERRRCPQFCLRRQLFQHSLLAKSLFHITQNSATVHTPSVFAPFPCHPKSTADSSQKIHLTTRTEHLEENPRVQSVWCKNPRAGDSRYTNPYNTAGELESTRLQPLGKIDISKRGPDSEPSWTRKSVKILPALADTEQAPSLTEGIKLLAGEQSAQVEAVDVSGWRLDKLGKWSNEAQKLLFEIAHRTF